ncbi:MAG: spermidine/putrescine ABC transporter substrate-binding protein [Deltaproteobacteria bacterium]|jgi:spermidine/putrescine transport system substrate-binding protein|nr:spermidine/putrescine ABC transporter substrate-binding protein [Deltaproteobacteria bacterium]
MNLKNAAKALLVMAMLAFALAACGGDDRKEGEETQGGAKPTSAAPAPGQADAGKKLTIFIWSEYIDPEVISDFEKTHNVRVKLDLYESNEEMISALQTGRQGAYDIIVPTTYFLPSLINLGLIQPIRKELLPNLGNLDPSFTEIEEDPGNKFNVPYQWGTSGMAIRAKPGQTYENSWDLLFKPSLDKGNFIIFDTARDALGAALMYLGYSSNTIDPAQVKEAGDLLIQAKNQPTFMSFNGGVDGLSNVMGGVASIAQVYSGESVKASLEDPEVKYVIPKEGCEIWMDVFAIPTGAANVEVAHEFLNYILEPEIAARLATYSKYGTPNAKAMSLIPTEDRDNPGIYPPQDLRANMQYYKDLGNDGRLFEETWTFVKSR